MSRRAHQGRRRPGRRPPSNGPVHRPSLPIPRGFTLPGWLPAPTVILPHRGRDKRPSFYEVDEAMIAGAGVNLCRMALEDGLPNPR
jgi:hypothetical protein